jgi:hypothetical protein
MLARSYDTPLFILRELFVFLDVAILGGNKKLGFWMIKMPKIISYTPSWLSRPSPGFGLFSADGKKLSADADKFSDPKSRNGTARKEVWLGPRRTLARRETEVFVVVGNTIRWADLRALKEEGEAQEQDKRRVVKSIEKTEQDGIGSKLSSYKVGLSLLRIVHS